MEDRVLVAYSTKYGATAEIAQRIGVVLRQAGRKVDVLAAGEVSDLAPYRAVVLGSGVYNQKWYREAVSFLKTREEELAKRPVWLFSSGPIGRSDALLMTKGWRFPKAQQALADRIGPRDIALFHGKMDLDQVSRTQRWIFTLMKAPTGDFRRWDEIVAWAKGITAALNQEG